MIAASSDNARAADEVVVASASQRAKMRGQHVRAGQDLHAAPRTLLPSGRISQPSARRSASAVLPHAAAAPWPSQRTGAYRGVTQRDPESETQRQRGQGGARAWGLSSCQGGGLREALRRDQIYEAETAPPAATIIGIAFFAAIGGASDRSVLSRLPRNRNNIRCTLNNIRTFNRLLAAGESA